MKLLLASKSPRRRELLSQLGFPVDYISIDVDEHIDAALPSDMVAEHLACRKADAFTGSLSDCEVLVTADTVVVHRGNVLGKPADRSQAFAMLRELSGERHTVYTGVCLRSNNDRCSFTEATDVLFNRLDESDIEYYVDRYRPFDKAGAYGIQEWIGMVGIGSIEGCYYNVMGLPVARLYTTLKNRFLSM